MTGIVALVSDLAKAVVYALAGRPINPTEMGDVETVRNGAELPGPLGEGMPSAPPHPQEARGAVKLEPVPWGALKWVRGIAEEPASAAIGEAQRLCRDPEALNLIPAIPGIAVSAGFACKHCGQCAKTKDVIRHHQRQSAGTVDAGCRAEPGVVACHFQKVFGNGTLGSSNVEVVPIVKSKLEADAWTKSTAFGQAVSPFTAASMTTISRTGFKRREDAACGWLR